MTEGLQTHRLQPFAVIPASLHKPWSGRQPLVHNSSDVLSVDYAVFVQVQRCLIAVTMGAEAAPPAVSNWLGAKPVPLARQKPEKL
jgi:hypothetical protein